jgi:hypothetical protein
MHTVVVENKGVTEHGFCRTVGVEQQESFIKVEYDMRRMASKLPDGKTPEGSQYCPNLRAHCMAASSKVCGI